MPRYDDSFDADYEREVERRRAEREARRLQEIEDRAALADAVDESTADPNAPPTADPNAPPTADPNADPSDSNVFQDVATGFAGGIRDAGVNIAQTIFDLGGLVDSGIDVDAAVPKVEPTGSTTEALTRGITQFLTGFVPVVGVMGKIGKVGQVSRALASARAAGGLRAVAVGGAARSAAAGAVADFAVWNPQEARFSDLVNDLGLSNPITEFLAADPEDSNAEGRMKNVIEGLGLGLIAEVVIAGVKATRSFQRAHATTVLQGQDELVSGTVKSTYESAAFAREQLDEAVTIRDEFERAGSDPGDPVVAEARGAQEGVPLSPEAQQMADSAALRGQTIDEFGAPFDEAARAESPLGQARAENPEGTQRVIDATEAAKGRLEELVNARMRDLEAAEDAVLSLHADPDYRALPLEVRQQYEQTLDSLVPEGARPTIEQVRAARSVENGGDAALGTSHIPDSAAPDIDPDSVFRGETLDIPSFTRYVQQRDAKLGNARSTRMIATDDPVFFKAATRIFAKERAGLPLDYETLGQLLDLNNMNVRRIADDDVVRAEADEFATLIATLRGTPKTRSVDATMEAGRREAQRYAHALGREDSSETLLRNMLKYKNDVVDNIDVTLAGIRVFNETTRARASRLAKAVLAGDDTSVTLADLLRAYDQAAQVQSVMDGFKTSIGRTLGSLRGEARALDPLAVLTDSQELIRTFGGTDRVKELAQRMLPALDNLTAMDKFVRANGRAGLAGRMGLHVWLNGILSGPITFAVNTISNAVVPLWTTGEMWLQGAFTGNAQLMEGALRQLKGIPAGFRAALRLTEAGRSTLLGAVKDVGSANPNAIARARVDFAQAGDEIGSAWKSLVTEESSFGGRRAFDIDERRAVTPGNARRLVGEKYAGRFADDTFGGKMVEWFGMASGVPGRLLAASDELAKGVNYRMAMERLAWEDAIGRKLAGTDMDAHIQKLIQDVPDWATNPHLAADERALYSSLHDQAVRQAEINTFTDPLHGMSKSLQDFTTKHPAFKLLMPFVRTPSNILKFVGERTPGVANLTHRYKEAVLAAKGGDTAALQAARARIGIGTGLYTIASIAAYNGVITGAGPGNPEERKALQATGWQPFSFALRRENGSVEYVSYNRLDPIGLFLGLAANLGETVGMMEDASDSTDVFAAALISLAENLKSKSYLTGITAAVDALNDPERRLPSFLERLGSSLVPNFIASTNRTGIVGGVGITGEADHLMRETDSLLDAIRAKLPGLSTNLPPRRNWFGEPITYGMGVGPDVVSPFQTRTSEGTLVNSEVNRLAREHGFTASMSPYKAIGTTKLTPEQRDRFIVLATGDPNRNGRNLRDDLDRLMQTRKYQQADDSRDGKQSLIRQLIADRRERAKKALLREQPELRDAIKAADRERRAARNQPQQQPSSLLSSLTGTPPALR